MKGKYARIIAALAIIAVMIAGCGKQSQQSQEVVVNSYKLSTSDTNVPQSFSGTVVAENSVAVHARVSGYVVEKYVKGGDKVVAGQPLYRIDSRQYEANLANAQATAASANASYQNSLVDLQRYQVLANQDAIARQTLDTQRSQSEQARATLDAYEAAVKIAQDNLNDTVVYAPYSGTLEMDDVDLGTFVNAGSTTLVTIDSADPIFVQFSMSEPEYLQFMKARSGDNRGGLQLKLSDGTVYKYEGALVQAAKNLDNSTGKLILKASFPNPDHLLLPNMYGTIIDPGNKIANAILVPSRAILSVLDKNFIFVIGDDNKVVQTPVTLGSTLGQYTIVTSGLKAGDQIVVDGLTKVKNGTLVKPTLLTKSQLDSNTTK